MFENRYMYTAGKPQNTENSPGMTDCQITINYSHVSSFTDKTTFVGISGLSSVFMVKANSPFL